MCRALNASDLAQPVGQLSSGRKSDLFTRFDPFVFYDLFDGRLWSSCVKVQDTNGWPTGIRLAANCHLSDVYVVFGQHASDVANDSRHIAVREDQQVAIHVGFGAVLAKFCLLYTSDAADE